MVHWSPKFSRSNYPIGYIRILAARLRRKSRIGLNWTFKGPRPCGIRGDTQKLEELRNLHQGKRCFVLGNGPSLKNTDLKFLKDEITIGTNGLYRIFEERDFQTNYLLFEDIEQTELHGSQIRHIKGPVKLAATHNAHAIARPWNDLIFMNARLADDYYWNNLGIQFSKDFSHIVYLGSTVSYIGLQLAYHLGCNEVYLIGMDFDYGPIADGNASGKIEITAENIKDIQQSHFSPDYYKTGQTIGIPNYQLQEQAFKTARQAFEADGRKIYNATLGGKLNVYERVNYQDLFDT